MKSHAKARARTLIYYTTSTTTTTTTTAAAAAEADCIKKKSQFFFSCSLLIPPAADIGIGQSYLRGAQTQQSFAAKGRCCSLSLSFSPSLVSPIASSHLSFYSFASTFNNRRRCCVMVKLLLLVLVMSYPCFYLSPLLSPLLLLSSLSLPFPPFFFFCLPYPHF